MPRAFAIVASALLLAAVLDLRVAGADGAWLDGPVANWNQPSMAIPRAPATDPAVNPRCLEQIVLPVSTPEKALVDAGWLLSGTRIAGLPIEIVSAQASYDGMCRPLAYQAFVFVNGTFAGTLSPSLMDSRSDGAIVGTSQQPGDVIVGTYVRYTDRDPLCCPSARSMATFKIDRSGAAPVVLLQSVTTEPTGAPTPPAIPSPVPSPAPSATPRPAPIQAPAQVPRSQ